LALRIGRRRDGPRHTLLALFGIAIVIGMLVAWVAVAVVAWTAIFSASEGAVRDASTGQPASLFERAWFVGYSLFTLGSGPYSAGDGLWQLAAVATGASGLVMVTLAIAYFVPVASAVAERRQLAQYVFSLGWTPEEILVASWTGRGFGSLVQHLVALTPLVHLAGVHHLTYPAVDYFHSVSLQTEAAGDARFAGAVVTAETNSAASPGPVVVVHLQGQGRLAAVHGAGEKDQFSHGGNSCRQP
jgi:hypothetical protein